MNEPARAGAYRGERPEVQALVPSDARRVLDLGCSAGAIGAALKRDRDVEVVGIEIDPTYAREAATRLDRVIPGDVEHALSRAEELGGRFDCLIAADVLEHLVDPWSALAQAAQLLEPRGTAIVSLPNVRFFETFWQLGVRGTWPRREQGIFDRSHLRWFTLKDARELVEQAGLDLQQTQPLIRIRPIGSRLDRFAAPLLARTPLSPFFAFQYLLLAVKR